MLKRAHVSWLSNAVTLSLIIGNSRKSLIRDEDDASDWPTLLGFVTTFVNLLRLEVDELEVDELDDFDELYDQCNKCN